jgi:hypothetical protein
MQPCVGFERFVTDRSSSLFYQVSVDERFVFFFHRYALIPHRLGRAELPLRTFADSYAVDTVRVGAGLLMDEDAPMQAPPVRGSWAPWAIAVVGVALGAFGLYRFTSAGTGDLPDQPRTKWRPCSMNKGMFAMVRFASGRGKYGFEHPYDVAKGINELFSRGELLVAPAATYNMLLYFINLRFRKVAQNVLL